MALGLHFLVTATRQQLLAAGPTLDEARRWWQLAITSQKDGDVCPCCDRTGRIYKWSLYRTAVQLFIYMYRVGGTTTPVHVNDVKGKFPAYKGQGDGSRLRDWGLAEELRNAPKRGGRASGFWRVTELGEDFLLGRAYVDKYKSVYDGRVLSSYGPQVRIHQVLEQFDYDQYMNR